MHTETERKFLVKSMDFKLEAVENHRITQGYIANEKGRTVRVRISDDIGYLTIKGPSENGISRLEWEKEISLEDAKDLFLLCKSGVIDKIRWIVPAITSDGRERVFEVDEFFGENEGLIVAEIELGSEDEAFEHPSWLGKEVSGDRKYYNSSLTIHPFKTWEEG